MATQAGNTTALQTPRWLRRIIVTSRRSNLFPLIEGLCVLWLLATALIGSCFLGVQVYEYYQLMRGHYYPVGISRTHHFTPDVSLFASCFFTMTGFHGAHVAGGVVMLTCLLIQSLRGAYPRSRHSPVELVGLYWHFVDLVWIILFTIVYLL